MILAIHLNDKMIFQRNEISDICPYDMLAAEMNTQLVSL